MASTVYSEQPLDKIRDLQIKLAQIKLQYSGFVVFTSTYLIEQEIVDSIHQKMQANHVSSKIIERTYLDKQIIRQPGVKGVEFFIKSDYISDSGFPVSLIIEHGRKAYDIYGHPLTWIGKDGKRHFAEHVKIPRKHPGRYIISTIKEKRPVVQQRLNEETAKWIKGILNS